MVEGVKDLVETKIHAKHEVFHTDIEVGEASWIYADGIRIKQVMVNLLLNANKFTDDYGEITWKLKLYPFYTKTQDHL